MENPRTDQLEQTVQTPAELERRLLMQVEVARILAEADSLANAATKLLQAICESLGCDLGQFWIVDRQVNKLRWIAGWQCESLSVAEFIAASRTRFFGQGAGLPGRIWASGAPEWIDEIANDRSFPRVA